MSMKGAEHVRRAKVEQEFQRHAREIAERVAAQFQPVYDRVCRSRDEAIKRAAILQTAIERIALAHVDDAQAEARRVLDELGIVPHVHTLDDQPPA